MLNNYNLIIFDTSFLLSLYEYSAETIEEVLIILEKNKNKIWLPHQVYKEFEKNLKDKDLKKAAISNYNLPNKKLNMIVEKSSKELSNQLYEYKTKRFPKIKKLSKELEKKLDEIRDIIKKYNNSIKEEQQKNKLFHKEDKIHSFVKELKEISQVGESYSSIELLNIYREGEERYTYKIPPGYKDDERYSKDKGKKTPDKFGDLLVWKQILKKVENKSQKVLFITNDKKEDWIENNQLREELLLEFAQSTEYSTIKKLNLDEFMNETNIVSREIKVKKLINDSLFEENFLISEIIEKLNLNLESKIKLYLSQVPNSLSCELIVESVFVDLLNYIDIDGLEIEESDEDELFRVILNLEVEAKIEINDYFNANTVLYIYIEIMVKTGETLTIQEVQEIEFKIKSVFSDDDNVCYICNINEGLYETENGDIICEKCSTNLICCSDCGILFEETSEKLWGHKCKNCVMAEDD